MPCIKTKPRYGAHLSKEETETLLAPHPSSVEAVEDWLNHHGIALPDSSGRSGAGDWITIRVSVAQAERLLGTKYNTYHHSSSDHHVVRAMSYALPRKLHSHVNVVAPTTYFGTLRSMRATSFLQPEIKPVEEEAKVLGPNQVAAAVPASCATTITPACLRGLYNTTSYVPKATAVNKLGVAGYLSEFANRADLQVGLGCLYSEPQSTDFSGIKDLLR